MLRSVPGANACRETSRLPVLANCERPLTIELRTLPAADITKRETLDLLLPVEQ